MDNTAVDLAGEGSGSLSRRSPRVVLTLAEVEQVTQRLLREPYFAFDVETTSLDPRTNELLWIGLGGAGSVYLIPCRHPKGIQLKAAHKKKTAAFLLYGPDDPRSFTEVLKKPSMKMVEHLVPAVYAAPPEQLFAGDVLAALKPLMFSDRGKLGHNVKFDLQSVAKYYGGEIPPGPYHDTILVRHTLDEDKVSYELKTLVCDWYEIPLEKRAAFYPKMGKAGVENFGLDEVARYLAKDVRFCWLMFERFYPQLMRKGLRQVYDFEMNVYPAIIAMEQVGFPVDLSKMDEVRQDLETRIKAVEEECFDLAKGEFALSKLNDKRWVLFGEGTRPEQRPLPGDLKVRTRTKKEKLASVTGPVLEYYADKGNRMAALLLEWAGLEKLRGTFIEGLHGFLHSHNGELPTVHTRYRQHGTVTGRLSSATPNLQQLPRDPKSKIRELFVAGPGKLLVVADYDQVELRCAGFLSGDPNMLQVFKKGQDIHAQAAAAMFGIPIEKVTGPQRDVGKTQNFAVLYGAGPDKIAVVAGCTKEQAQVLIRGYFQEFPALLKWKDKELRAARNRGWPPHVVIPPNGRIRRLRDLVEIDDNYLRYRAERQAINAIVQGFASNITKMAMISLHDQLPRCARMLAQVHDEIVIQVDEDEALPVLDLAVNIMGSIVDPTTGKPILGEIPLVASAAVGRSWADAKAKHV